MGMLSFFPHIIQIYINIQYKICQFLICHPTAGRGRPALQSAYQNVLAKCRPQADEIIGPCGRRNFAGAGVLTGPLQQTASAPPAYFLFRGLGSGVTASAIPTISRLCSALSMSKM